LWSVVQNILISDQFLGDIAESDFAYW